MSEQPQSETQPVTETVTNEIPTPAMQAVQVEPVTPDMVMYPDPQKAGSFIQITKEEADRLDAMKRQVKAEPEEETDNDIALFEDELEGAGKYSFVVELGNEKVYCRDLSKKDYQDYKDLTHRIAKETRRLAGLSKAQSEGKTFSDEEQEKALQESEALAQLQLDSYDLVNARAVVKWSMKRPCNPATIAQLTPSAKNRLHQLILQGSRLGRTQSDFLPTRSKR